MKSIPSPTIVETYDECVRIGLDPSAISPQVCAAIRNSLYLKRVTKAIKERGFGSDGVLIILDEMRHLQLNAVFDHTRDAAISGMAATFSRAIKTHDAFVRLREATAISGAMRWEWSQEAPINEICGKVSVSI